MIFDNPRRAEFKLTNNYVFHAVYGSDTKKSRDALMALLNTILERKNDPIVSIKLLNPASVPWREDDKYIIMDIRAITNSGEIINIEMQNGNLSNYKERATYYGGVLLNNALETGEDYDMLKKCIVISIVNNGILFKENKRCYNIFDIRNTQDNFPMTDRLKWYFVELDKIDPEQSVDTLTPIEAVGAYFKYGSDPSKEDYIEKLLKSGEEAIKMSEPILREITEDEKEYHRMISRRMAEHDEATRIHAAKAEGLAEGKAEGLAEGEFKAKKQNALTMLKKGLDIQLISEITGLSAEEIKQLK